MSWCLRVATRRASNSAVEVDGESWETSSIPPVVEASKERKEPNVGEEETIAHLASREPPESSKEVVPA